MLKWKKELLNTIQLSLVIGSSTLLLDGLYLYVLLPRTSLLPSMTYWYQHLP